MLLLQGMSFVAIYKRAWRSQTIWHQKLLRHALMTFSSCMMTSRLIMNWQSVKRNVTWSSLTPFCWPWKQVCSATKRVPQDDNRQSSHHLLGLSCHRSALTWTMSMQGCCKNECKEISKRGMQPARNALLLVETSLWAPPTMDPKIWSHRKSLSPLSIWRLWHRMEFMPLS